MGMATEGRANEARSPHQNVLAVVAELRRAHNRYLAENPSIATEGFEPYANPDAVDPDDPAVLGLQAFYAKILTQRAVEQPTDAAVPAAEEAAHAASKHSLLALLLAGAVGYGAAALLQRLWRTKPKAASELRPASTDRTGDNRRAAPDE